VIDYRNKEGELGVESKARNSGKIYKIREIFPFYRFASFRDKVIFLVAVLFACL
jgi:hypothetical protein